MTTLFDAQVRRSPDAKALTLDRSTVSYRELDRRANRLAGFLQQRGAGRGTLIGIGLGRSIDLVCGVLATLKTGAAFVPLDPTYPAARLEHMMHDSGLPLILADASFGAVVGGTACEVLMLDTFDWDGAGVVDAPAGTAAGADDPAYVLYTSGSTGRPKATVGRHRGAVNRCHWMWGAFDFDVDDVFCLRTSLNFVDSVWEIFGALTHGASLAIMPDSIANDPRRLLDWLAGRPVSQLVLVPSLLREMLDAEPELGRRLPLIRTWICSGEPLAPELLDRFKAAAPQARLLNTYGTSEIWDATCFDTSGWLPGRERVPIGKPIANVQTYVLDKRMQPVPPGVGGELYVGGAGLGAGYWNQSELTAERFVRNPFEDSAGPLYRTGDRARYLPGGDLECLGRADRQIKLRGNRVEPGEIESALCSCAGVGDASVDLRPDPSGEPHLVAWCVGAKFDAAGLRRQLRKLLPASMVPSVFIEIPDLPLTPSGKPDRRALPDPRWAAPAKAGPVAPATATEKAVARLWEEVLDASSAGLYDDFFESGGHSLSATRLLARIRSAFAVDVSLQALFDAPNILGIAARVDDLLRAVDPGDDSTEETLPEISRDAPLPLSFGQERLWFLDQLDPASPAYNIAFTVSLRGDIDVDALRAALDAVIARHEVLRSTFPDSGGTPVLEFATGFHLPLDIEDFSTESADAFQSRLAKISVRPFDLASGPLLRAGLFRLGPDEHRLLVVIHHIISDGISNGIFFTDLAAHYEAAVSGVEPMLPALPVQYADYASWQRDFLAGDRFDGQRTYWMQQLAGAPPALELPTDRPRAANRYFPGRLALAEDRRPRRPMRCGRSGAPTVALYIWSC